MMSSDYQANSSGPLSIRVAGPGLETQMTPHLPSPTPRPHPVGPSPAPPTKATNT